MRCVTGDVKCQQTILLLAQLNIVNIQLTPGRFNVKSIISPFILISVESSVVQLSFVRTVDTTPRFKQPFITVRLSEFAMRNRFPSPSNWPGLLEVQTRLLVASRKTTNKTLS